MMIKKTGLSILTILIAGVIVDRLWDIDGEAAIYVSEVTVTEAAITANSIKNVNDCDDNNLPLEVEIECLKIANRDYREKIKKIDVLGKTESLEEEGLKE